MGRAVIKGEDAGEQQEDGGCRQGHRDGLGTCEHVLQRVQAGPDTICLALCRRLTQCLAS